MRRGIPLIAGIALVLSGCSSGDNPGNGGGPAGNDEVISAPVRPSGPSFGQPGTPYTFSSGGAVSTEGHAIEYRFDLDTNGAHDYTPWLDSATFQKLWPNAGSWGISARARCKEHPDKVSELSLVKIIEIGLGPEVQVTGVINRYYIGNNEFTRTLDITDAVPDTVPFNSWVTLYYTGTPTVIGEQECVDVIDKCLKFQFQYSWVSALGINFTDTWRPFDGEDNGPGTADSTSINVGTVDYTFRMRASDVTGRNTPVPPEVHIVGSYSPTLESFDVEDEDGTMLADGDTIRWSWANPSNFTGAIIDTLDFTDPTNPLVVRKFRFTLAASGHDHPTEQLNSGVKSWRYTFVNNGFTPPRSETFGRAGVWRDGVTVNVLDEAVEITFRYSLMNDPGGHIIRASTDFFDKEIECTLQGRDRSSTDEFTQKEVIDGGKITLNQYNVSEEARRTEQLTRRFYLSMDD